MNTATKDQHPKISVVMPVYNAERYLKESIDSILRQTYTDFEFIIINDGSTDKSQDIINHYKSIDSRIVAIEQENCGVVATANLAAKLAKGEYLSRTDADDVSFDNKLEDLIKCAEKNPNAVVVCGSIEVIDEYSEYVYRDLVLTENDDLKRAFYLRNPIPNGASLIKKAAFESVGGYDNVFAEDCHLWTKLFRIGDFAGTGTTIYRWRMNTSGLTLSNNQKSTEKEKEYVDIIWSYGMPTPLTRREIIAKSKVYAFSGRPHAIAYKKVFLSDLSRLSIHLIKRGHLLQGLSQLFIITSTGRTGVRTVLKRIHLVGQGHYNRLRKKVAYSTDN